MSMVSSSSKELVFPYFHCVFQERDSDREQIQYLIELNAKLEFEKKMSSGTDSNLEDELQHSRDMACKSEYCLLFS